MTDPLDHSSDAVLHGFPIAADAEKLGARESVEVIASRFADEVRRGLKPSIEDYVIRHRLLEAELRECLPVVEALERWKYDKEAECVRRNLPLTLPFEQLGEYRLARELGRGGTGVVYEGIEPRTGRSVAVKLLPWRYLSDLPRRKERFQKEASTIARLRHTNIVPIYTFGEQDGYCYYVMQLVEGVSLDRVIQRLRETPAVAASDMAHKPNDPRAVPQRSRKLTRNSWNGFAHIGAQVAFGLAHAHGQSVLHNDIKPANLILDSTGRIVVTDFGGGNLGDAGVAEFDDAPVGTLRYLAPERMEGHSDARSDVYSLGVTLYELVTLEHAFEHADRGVLAERIRDAEFRPPREVNPEIPRPLEAIVLKAMSRQPDDRYPAARPLALDLMRFVNGQPVEARPPSLLARARRWLRAKS